jgi:hypothetical protein
VDEERKRGERDHKASRALDPAALFVRAAEKLVARYELTSRRSRGGGSTGVNPLRHAVKRNGAGRNMLLIAMTFAGSVALTRAFLEIAGYPQIATSELHIAHVLWGGLLLFLGTLLPLTLLNGWVYPLAAILAGTGMGLFMDEVGKFITQSNNYFYEPAAPIIYLVFLISLWLYVRVGRPASQEPRAVMYRALEGFGELLDRDLDTNERSRLSAQLAYVHGAAGEDDLRRLAGKLQEFLESDELALTPPPPTVTERLRRWISEIETRWLPQTRLKPLLCLAMAVLGFLAMDNLLRLALGNGDPTTLQAVVLRLLDEGGSPVLAKATAFSTWVGSEAVMGLILLAALAMWVSGHEALGLRFARRTLLMYIGVVDLLVFYFDQFSSILLAGFQIALMVGLAHYQRRFPTPDIS